MELLNIITILLITCLVGSSSTEVSSSNKQLRLIGAEPAAVGQFPWIVSLQRDKTGNGEIKHFCAGSIVDPTHIVTAAHCVWNKTSPAIPIMVLAGALNISATEEGQQRVNVSSIHLHPKYQSQNRAGSYDIAVLTLSSALKFDERVSSIALPDKDEIASGSCQYAGWGNRFLISGIYYNPSDVLRTVSSRAISKFMCRASYLFAFRGQLDTALCTHAGPLKGSCQGDSGGSVTCYKSDNTPYLAGVVSWGWFICGDGIHPDVSTDVSLFNDFINSFLTTDKNNMVSLS